MKLLTTSILVVLSFFAFSCAPVEKELIVATYDSFVADYGAGPKLATLFEKQTGVKVTFRSKGDGGQLLSDLAQSGKDADADIVLGLDNFLAPKALALGLFSPYAPPNLASVPVDLRIDSSNRLLPFDYGFFAIIYDSQRTKDLPKSLEDFATARYARKLILMDPRTSTPGLGFFAWTRAVYGEAWQDYWKRLAPSILAMTPGWDSGYGLFLAGEAPFVLSYSTSPAYHKENEGGERYRVLPLAEGAPREIEVAGILKTAKHRRSAEAFMNFLLSPEAQAELPLTQWMYPIRPEVKLPASYEAAIMPAKVLETTTENLLSDAAKVANILASRPSP